MANISTGGSTSGNMDVNPQFEAQVALTKVLANAGYALAVAENDAGSLFGAKRVRSLQTSEAGALQVGLSTPLFEYTFNAALQDTGSMRYFNTSMAVAWTGTGMLLNSGSNVASGAGVGVVTCRQFPLNFNGGLKFDFVMSLTVGGLLTNQEITVGLFTSSGTFSTIPLEGVYVRLTTAGLQGVANYNGVETSTGIMASAASFVTDVSTIISIVIYERNIFFLRDGVLMANGILATPANAGQSTGTGAFPATFQFRNVNAVTGSPVAQAKITNFLVTQLDSNIGIPFPTLQALQNLMGSQGTNGSVMGSTALLSNNLAAGAGAAMTNTTAALGTGLGGQFSVQPTLAVGIDGIVCSFQNPPGGINQKPRTLLIYGIRIQGAVTTTLVGGTVLYQYSLAYGHTNVSLATTETQNSKAPRRESLGLGTYAANAAVGVLGSAGVSDPFVSAIIINPGEFVAIVAKNQGVVTTAGVITICVTFDSCWA